MKFLSLIIVVSLITSCSTAITQEGAKVRPLTAMEKEKYSCEFLGMVTGSHGEGWTAGGNQESAMNETRNKVSELKGNAFIIVSSDGGNWLDATSTFNAEALKCDFSKK